MNRKLALIIVASVLILSMVVGLIIWLRGRSLDTLNIPPSQNGSATAIPTAEESLPPPLDTDRDSISDDDEAALGTNPQAQDTDGDGYTDFFEIDTGTDPLNASDAPTGQVRSEEVFRELYGSTESEGETPTPEPTPSSSDPDNDGLTTIQEEQIGTDPNNPDTDGDGFNDGDEVQAGYNPLGPGRLQ
jgi:hypothetical protein